MSFASRRFPVLSALVLILVPCFALGPCLSAWGDDDATLVERLEAVEEELRNQPAWLKSLDVGGAVRVRGESKSPFNYMVANRNRSEDFALLRSRLHIGFDVNEHLAALLEFQDARVFGEEMSLVADTDGADLQQGHIILKNLEDLCLGEADDSWDLTVYAGRKRLPNYGDQRMISSLDWGNVGRTFDGAQVVAKSEHAQVDFLYALINEGAGVTGAGNDDVLGGVYATTSAVPNVTLDGYWFGRNFKTDGVTGENGAVGDLEDHTFGARAKAKSNGFHATVEAARQSGDFSSDTVQAWAWATEVGIASAPGSVPLSPAFAAGWTFATGDGNPNDGKRETFTPVAPFGHAYQGHYDIFAWQNGHDYYLKAKVSPMKKCTAHADFHFFRLAEDKDAWYNAGGAVLRRDPTGNSGKNIGRELDLYLKCTVFDHLKIWTGWSHFWDGSYVGRTGGGGQGDFFFFQMELFFGSNVKR